MDVGSIAADELINPATGRYRTRSHRRAAHRACHAMAAEHGHRADAMAAAHPGLGSAAMVRGLLRSPPPRGMEASPRPMTRTPTRAWRTAVRALGVHRLAQAGPTATAEELSGRIATDVATIARHADRTLTARTVRAYLRTPAADWIRREAACRPAGAEPPPLPEALTEPQAPPARRRPPKATKPRIRKGYPQATVARGRVGTAEQGRTERTRAKATERRNVKPTKRRATEPAKPNRERTPQPPRRAEPTAAAEPPPAHWASRASDEPAATRQDDVHGAIAHLRRRLIGEPRPDGFTVTGPAGTWTTRGGTGGSTNAMALELLAMARSLEPRRDAPSARMLD